jgi:hypothetical protein
MKIYSVAAQLLHADSQDEGVTFHNSANETGNSVRVLHVSENKQQPFPYTALTNWFYNQNEAGLLCGTTSVFIGSPV